MEIGYYCILITFSLTAFSIWAGVTGLKLKNESLTQKAKLSIYGQFIFTSISILLLAFAFLNRDFSLSYVAEYSDSKLPLLYTISAVWAGQAGSLLFWAWLLTVFNAIYVFVNRHRTDEFQSYVFTIHSVVTMFFILLVIFVSNPFEKLPSPLPDGYGLNPLLQNPGMIFHPPSLFLGFVGITIPFAYALAALIKGGKISSDWLDKCRKWALVAWLALTLGNLLGAQWAYVELGWGGYWAWDPVENASLLPWLTATAFIHSLMSQKARKMMKVWTIFLIIITFLLTILGTFITRSGIISSVHAFGKSNIGPLFLIFMGIIFTVSLLLIIWRWQQLKPEFRIDSFLSREFGFLLTNIVFTVLTAAILWGTMYPLFSEMIHSKPVTLGEHYFNTISVPIGIFLLLLMAVCPLLPWRKTDASKLKKRFLLPILSFVIFIGILSIAGMHHFYALITSGFCFLAIANIVIELIPGTSLRMKKNQENFIQSFRNTIKFNLRRYAGLMIHLGVIMIYLSIIGTTVYKQKKEITLNKGEETTIGNYRLVYKKMSERHEKNKQVLLAELDMYKNGTRLGALAPQRNFYVSGLGNEHQTSEVAIRSTLKEDLFVILSSFQSDESATFVMMINPLMNLMWIGGGFIKFGVIIIIINSRKKSVNREKIKSRKEK